VRARVDGAALRQARVARGLTQADVARGVHVAGGERVSAWEREAGFPDVRLVPLLAAVLDVDPLSLLRLPDEGVDLRGLRWAAGLTAEEVASRLHVSRSTFLGWESGARRLPGDEALLETLARALNTSPEVVLRVQDRRQRLGRGRWCQRSWKVSSAAVVCWSRATRRGDDSA